MGHASTILLIINLVGRWDAATLYLPRGLLTNNCLFYHGGILESTLLKEELYAVCTMA